MRPGRPEGAQEERLRRRHEAAPPVRCKAPAPARRLFWGYKRSERQHPGSHVQWASKKWPPYAAHAHAHQTAFASLSVEQICCPAPSCSFYLTV